MRAAGLTDLSEKAFRAARRALEGAGLLKMVGKHLAGAHGQSFTLSRLRPSMNGAGNVLALQPGANPRRGRGRQGERLRLHMTGEIDRHMGRK